MSRDRPENKFLLLSASPETFIADDLDLERRFCVHAVRWITFPLDTAWNSRIGMLLVAATRRNHGQNVRSNQDHLLRALKSFDETSPEVSCLTLLTLYHCLILCDNERDSEHTNNDIFSMRNLSTIPKMRDKQLRLQERSTQRAELRLIEWVSSSQVTDRNQLIIISDGPLGITDDTVFACGARNQSTKCCLWEAIGSSCDHILEIPLLAFLLWVDRFDPRENEDSSVLNREIHKNSLLIRRSQLSKSAVTLCNE